MGILHRRKRIDALGKVVELRRQLDNSVGKVRHALCKRDEVLAQDCRVMRRRIDLGEALQEGSELMGCVLDVSRFARHLPTMARFPGTMTTRAQAPAP